MTTHGPLPTGIRFNSAALLPPSHSEFVERINRIAHEDDLRMQEKEQKAAARRKNLNNIEKVLDRKQEGKRFKYLVKR